MSKELTFDTDLTRNPITVDTKAIAKGLYQMFDENERACLAFGLLPEAKLAPVREHLTTVATRFWPDAEKVFSEEELAGFLETGLDVAALNRDRVQDARKKFVSDVEHQVCLDLYGVAPMVV